MLLKHYFEFKVIKPKHINVTFIMHFFNIFKTSFWMLPENGFNTQKVNTNFH